MQSDFRTTLYGRYLSTFKAQSASAPSTAWWDHKYLPLLEDLDRAAPVLELGCGDGALLAYLAERGFLNVAGVDISPEQVAVARRRGLDVDCADALAYLETRPLSQAALIAVDVLEHLTRDELIRLAGGMFVALRPGGRLLIQTANGAGLFPGQVIYGDLTHQTVFTPGSLSQLLTQAGFCGLSFYETGPIPIRVRGKLNVALWHAIKALANAARSIETGKRQAIWTENFICSAFKPAAFKPA
jgi:SAM-dependent methyltransferase